MPSLSAYALRLQAEDSTGGYSDEKLQERMGDLSSTQLKRFMKHLDAASSTAASNLWRSGNRQVWMAANDCYLAKTNAEMVEALEIEEEDLHNEMAAKKASTRSSLVSRTRRLEKP